MTCRYVVGLAGMHSPLLKRPSHASHDPWLAGHFGVAPQLISVKIIQMFFDQELTEIPRALSPRMEECVKHRSFSVIHWNLSISVEPDISDTEHLSFGDPSIDVGNVFDEPTMTTSLLRSSVRTATAHWWKYALWS
jgi:hypothetical protein